MAPSQVYRAEEAEVSTKPVPAVQSYSKRVKAGRVSVSTCQLYQTLTSRSCERGTASRWSHHNDFMSPWTRMMRQGHDVARDACQQHWL